VLRERLRTHGVPVFFSCDHGAVYLTLRRGGWHVQAQDGREESFSPNRRAYGGVRVGRGSRSPPGGG
jgi:hypothetical protein